MIHTINGEKVGSVTCEHSVQCLAYSNVPEGASINVLVGSLGSRIIRFWSSWDLLHVRDIVWEESRSPIVR